MLISGSYTSVTKEKHKTKSFSKTKNSKKHICLDALYWFMLGSCKGKGLKYNPHIRDVASKRHLGFT